MADRNAGCARQCGDCVECLSPLPLGETCASACVFVERCRAVFGQKGTEGACQFIPSRFSQRVA